MFSYGIALCLVMSDILRDSNIQIMLLCDDIWLFSYSTSTCHFCNTGSLGSFVLPDHIFGELVIL